MDELLAIISKEQTERFNKPWCKLDKGSKKNRIIYYAENYDCDEDNKVILKNLLIKLLNNNILKNEYIEYDNQSSCITNVKHLSFTDNNFTFTPNVIKHKSKIRNSKTKTKIERHLSRGKKQNPKLFKKIRISWYWDICFYKS